MENDYLLVYCYVVEDLQFKSFFNLFCIILTCQLINTSASKCQFAECKSKIKTKKQNTILSDFSFQKYIQEM